MKRIILLLLILTLPILSGCQSPKDQTGTWWEKVFFYFPTDADATATSEEQFDSLAERAIQEWSEYRSDIMLRVAYEDAFSKDCLSDIFDCDYAIDSYPTHINIYVSIDHLNGSIIASLAKIETVLYVELTQPHYPQTSDD